METYDSIFQALVYRELNGFDLGTLVEEYSPTTMKNYVDTLAKYGTDDYQLVNEYKNEVLRSPLMDSQREVINALLDLRRGTDKTETEELCDFLVDVIDSMDCVIYDRDTELQEHFKELAE